MKEIITVKKTARIAILGIMDDQNSSFKRGSAGAPPFIRAAYHSDSSNYWSENGTNLEIGQCLVDAGDIIPGPGETMITDIENSVKKILLAGLRPICLGGDHAVTYPILRAVSTFHKPLSILHFDAHPDLYEHFNGNRYSHASPFARIMESGLVKRLVQIGIRTMSGHQRAQADRFGVEVFEMKNWRDEIKFQFDSDVYISFDMDSLDPAFAPGVSHWEPGGFSVRQVLNVIQKIDSRVIGADIVEFNPISESQITSMVAAKVFKEIASKMLERIE